MFLLGFLKDHAWEVFRNGPSKWGYVGRSNESVCADLTGVDADHWGAATLTCGDLIQRHFEANWTIVRFLFAFGLTVYALIRVLIGLEHLMFLAVGRIKPIAWP